MGMKVDAATFAKLTGAKPKRNRAPVVTIPHENSWAVCFRVPCRVVSESNSGRAKDHWAIHSRRVNDQKEAVAFAWFSARLNGWHPSLPCEVVLTHYGPKMDDDNLRGAFKAIRDKVANLIGVNDNDRQVSWNYDQLPGDPCVYVLIRSPKA